MTRDSGSTFWIPCSRGTRLGLHSHRLIHERIRTMEEDYINLSDRMLKCPLCRNHLDQDFLRWDGIILAVAQNDSSDLAWEARNVGSCPTCGRDVKDQYLIYLKMIRERMSLPALSSKQKATILSFLEIKAASQNLRTPTQKAWTENTARNEAPDIKRLYDDLFFYLEQLTVNDPNHPAFSNDLSQYDKVLTKLSQLDSEDYRGFRLEGASDIKNYEVEILIRGILSYLASKYGYEFQVKSESLRGNGH